MFCSITVNRNNLEIFFLSLSLSLSLFLSTLNLNFEDNLTLKKEGGSQAVVTSEENSQSCVTLITANTKKVQIVPFKISKEEFNFLTEKNLIS